MQHSIVKSLKLVIAVILLSLSGSVIRGAVYTAADCTLAQVQSAVNSATNGDTVLMPAGSAVWTNQLNMPSKGINLIGAGMGQTIITDAWAATGGNLINSQSVTPHFIRISGFTIRGGLNSQAEINVGSLAQTNYFRVDHIQIVNLWKRGVQIEGWACGVVDHCSFANATNWPNPPNASGVIVYGENGYSWDTRPPSWGDTNKVYVEDCSFNWATNAQGANGAIDSYAGARWCFRHNSVTNTNIGDHGTDSGGTLRSTHSYEVYNNSIWGDPALSLRFFSFRGGSGIFFSNTLVSHARSSDSAIGVMDYRDSGTNIYTGPPATIFLTNAVFNGGGGIVSITLNPFLSSFSPDQPPSTANGYLTTTGGTGASLVAMVNSNNGQITNFQILNGGTGYSSSSTIIIALTPCCTPYGAVTGNNPYDGNTDPSGYPSFDSIGRTSPTTYFTGVPAPNNLLFGNLVSLAAWLATNDVSGFYTAMGINNVLANLLNSTNGYTIQPSQPLYSWNNTFNGADTGINVEDLNYTTNTGVYSNIPPVTYLIQPNRDFFNDTPMPGYVPLAYPHPLVTGSTLLPPSNLRIVTPGS